MFAICAEWLQRPCPLRDPMNLLKDIQDGSQLTHVFGVVMKKIFSQMQPPNFDKIRHSIFYTIPT